MKDYIEKAHVTLSDKFYGERISKPYFTSVIREAVQALEELDKVKKTLFYGKQCGICPPMADFFSVDLMAAWLTGKNGTEEDRARAINTVHGIIGKATEAAELLEALLAAVESKQPLDKTNLLEEVGDGFWYDAVILGAIGKDFAEAQTANIEKLSARFPERFSEYHANNRNLAVERKILEKGIDKAK